MTDLTQVNHTTTVIKALEIFNCYKELATKKLNINVKFDIGHNINTLRPIVENVESLKNDTSDIVDFEAYQKGLKEITMANMKDGKIQGPEQVAKYNSEIDAFRAKYPQVVDALDTKAKEFDTFVKREIEIKDLIKIKLSRLPAELEIDISPIVPLIERD